MAGTYPENPTVGQQVFVGNKTMEWNGRAWKVVGGGSGGSGSGGGSIVISINDNLPNPASVSEGTEVTIRETFKTYKLVDGVWYGYGQVVVDDFDDLNYANNIVEGTEAYIRSTGQTFIYVIEAGEATGQWTEKDQLGDDVDVTAARHLTLAQAQASDLKVGQYVRLVDRGGVLYKVVANSDTGGFYQPLGGAHKLKLEIHGDTVNARHIYDGNDLNPSIQEITSMGYLVDLNGGEFSIKSPATWHKTVYDSTGEGRLEIDYDSNPFATIDSDGVTPHGFLVDFKNNNCPRGIVVKENTVGSYCHDIEFLNVDSLTFHRSLEISDQGCVGIDVNNIRGKNIKAQENGTIGDNNGSCRLVYIGGFSGAVTNPTNGRIRNIHCDTLLPAEDGDMVHIISSYTGDFDISVENCSGVDVAKRLVKVQANGVDVMNVSASTRDSSIAMYSVVSHYGERGSVRNITGNGLILHGVEGYKEGTTIDTVKIDTTYSGGAGVMAQSSADIKNITANGCSHIALVRSVLENIDTLSISNLRGTVNEEAIKVSLEGYDIADLSISDIKGKAGSGRRFLRVVRTSGSNVVKKLSLTDLDQRVDSYFTGVDIAYCDEVNIENLTDDGSTSVSVYISAAKKVEISRVGCGDATATTVYLKDCENTAIDRVKTNLANIWSSGVLVEAADTVISSGRRYVAQNSGTTGATAPVHGSGTASDGGVSWSAGSLIQAITIDGGNRFVVANTLKQTGTVDVTQTNTPSNVLISGSLEFTNV